MLQTISIENFLSIRDKLTLSLEASASKKNLQNTIALPKKDRLLRSVALYGANASGKSNIIKATLFIWDMVKNSHAFNIDSTIPRTPYKLDEAWAGKLSRFELTFYHKRIRYRYGFSCDDKKIIDEYLYHWPKGREALIFKRSSTTDFTFIKDKRQQQLIKKRLTPNVLYLSRATALGLKATAPAYAFITDNLVINYSPTWFVYTAQKIKEDPALKTRVLGILAKADFGGIQDIMVSTEKKKVDGVEFRIEKQRKIFNHLVQEEREFNELKTIHTTAKGKHLTFSLKEESEGTQKIISLLGPLFDALDNGKVAIIDELESSLHPNLTRSLIRLFNSRKNTKGAQLIFTTHSTTLLDNRLFRRDQIYLCTKAPNKQTLLRSFLDYDLREDSDFERAYLNGRLGGVPIIDQTLLD
ncbi:hypothetical protein COY28_06510 [Candidatus Woesearchaeota archaeon CG_4_10_14_0_2_um_filter_57_5]|nr:MAG: hypothetical protein AUJ68_00390 [Candidatus Woesearchaeota archaeon CG1_02_57_44]PIZ49253.1 MAG: hypothetical protein COY28_06510 [Candidatus Woesearchaeota archaeon CG_4_10_14_0_2_um_filter_57_5]